MEFKLIQLYYFFSVFGFVLIFGFSQNISERFDKGLIVKKTMLRKLLWIRKNETYISYPSLIFVIIGYIYLFSLIPCNIICLFVSNYVAEAITYSYLAITYITGVVEALFLPSYGVKG